MRVDVITLFPEMFEGPFGCSMIKRARDQGLVTVNLVDLRDFTEDRHRTVDARPYGGGAGMVMKPEPLFRAVESLRRDDSQVLLMSPQGEPFRQAKARELARRQHLIVICGHYEGVDERVRQALVDEELSIGDYVLTNGNLAAMVVTDAVVRLLPGVLGCAESIVEESFSNNQLEYPQYTRPEDFRGLRVPTVLLGGNHAAIAAWRAEQARTRTAQRRPDLLERPRPDKLADRSDPEESQP